MCGGFLALSVFSVIKTKLPMSSTDSFIRLDPSSSLTTAVWKFMEMVVNPEDQLRNSFKGIFTLVRALFHQGRMPSPRSQAHLPRWQLVKLSTTMFHPSANITSKALWWRFYSKDIIECEPTLLRALETETILLLATAICHFHFQKNTYWDKYQRSSGDSQFLLNEVNDREIQMQIFRRE